MQLPPSYIRAVQHLCHVTETRLFAFPAGAHSHGVLPNGTAEQLGREEPPFCSPTGRGSSVSPPEEDSPADKQGPCGNGDMDNPPSNWKPNSSANGAAWADAGSAVESIYLDSNSLPQNRIQGDDSPSSMDYHAPDAGSHSWKQPLNGGSVLDAAGQCRQQQLSANSEPRITSDAAGQSHTGAGPEESATIYESPEPNGRAGTSAADSGSSGATKTSWGTPGEEPKDPSSRSSSSAMKKPKAGLRNVQRSAKKGYMIHRYRDFIIVYNSKGDPKCFLPADRDVQN